SMPRCVFVPSPGVLLRGTREHPRLTGLKLEALMLRPARTPAAIEICQKPAPFPIGRGGPVRVEDVPLKRRLELVSQCAPSRGLCQRLDEDLGALAQAWKPVHASMSPRFCYQRKHHSRLATRRARCGAD